jgi:hypothetical protein
MKTQEELQLLGQTLRDRRISMVWEDEFNTILRHRGGIESVKGDIVECGCWKGGFSIFLAHTFETKNIWVCDSFEGFQPLETATYEYPGERHVPSYGLGNPGTEDEFTLSRVKQYFEEYELGSQDRIKFVQGFVKDSLPTSGIKSIALLRIDVDAYSATREVLDALYDKVRPGGYIVFDDSCLYETIDAIKDFFKEKNIPNYIYHPVTDEALDLYQTYANTNSGFPAGCYIAKQS